MTGVNGVNSTNPYLAKLLNIFGGASDPADQTTKTGDMSSFLQELESQNNPSSQVNQTKTPPVGGRPSRELGPQRSLRSNMDTVEISEEAYEAFKQMHHQKSDSIDN